MGCDIHFFVEVRKDGIWTTADTWTIEEGDRNNYDHAFFSGRNYNLFSLLADVRSEDGAAPLSAPRGTPEDSCQEIKEVVAQWDGDGHSHSHFTVAELMAQDWHVGQRDEGSIPLGTFLEWDRWARKQGERPETWCGYTSCKTIDESEVAAFVKTIGEDEAKKMVNIFANRHPNPVYVRCSWTTARWKVAMHFLADTLTRLWKLGKPEDVRCVFFFDN